MSRLALSDGPVEFIGFDRPFSSFSFLEDRFPACPAPLRRLFSQARSRKCQSLIVENVQPAAAVQDEVEELQSLFHDYQLGGLVRISFWKERVAHEAGLDAVAEDQCIGYAILKRDQVPSLRVDRWHVFESLITKHDHKHNYSPCDKPVAFRVGLRTLHASGVIYGQQNSLNKACAQVSLRNLCLSYLGDHDLTFRRINSIAGRNQADFKPGEGLTFGQTLEVLRELGINYCVLDYSNELGLGASISYQRVVYSGIECGAGSLLVFRFQKPPPDDGSQATVEPNSATPTPEELHMIACFGHTFNEDTWAPTAEVEYFATGELRYIPSDAWMSSFLVHDDNFGSNLCIPKAYLDASKARSVIAFLPKGYRYAGFLAEMLAANFLYSLLKHLEDSPNKWLRRLVSAAQQRRLILRVVPITKEGYLRHLESRDDWQGRKEKEGAVGEISPMIARPVVWMVEVSFPDLFPTNKRKVGEVLLDATGELDPDSTWDLFVMARFPGTYVLPDRSESAPAAQQAPQFLTVPSDIESHVEVLIR